ncbi:salicylate hydroxylase, putative [Paecilomyces variotii No. 5]|uniref:Salicylate hydroxylase, putative n=1 Tax=Byssochlamys spectabilis (strain No. 5 / NBRC 109023) TaxID=1356009 RepID=V5GC22_BYSSN|nr:salicylate hydroxylase, putative [Paecilomyces variotii No. 5]
MPLKVVVVGAGIGGLSAAVALREAGHSVHVLEKSRFLGEVGAALLVAPNGARVLDRLGFSFTRARGMARSCWELLDGGSLEPIETADLRDAGDRFGAPLYTMQRAHLHKELADLATRSRKQDGLPDVTLSLGTRVCTADAETGVVVVEDGTQYHVDLIVAADGLHSVLRSVVLGNGQAAKPEPTGLSSFRFQLSTSAVANDPKFLELLKRKSDGPSILADTTDPMTARHMVWYDCQNGEVQNFVGVYDRQTQDNPQDCKSEMLAEFSHFHPDLLHMVQMAPEISNWPLSVYKPLPQWTSGKIVLIGDAAHPMLPFSGQGANQAIEDAGALGYMLADVHSSEDIPTRLKLFEKARMLRVARTQTLSKVRLGKEKEVQEELRQYADPPGSAVPATFPERYQHDFGFDVFGKCNKLLQGSKKINGNPVEIREPAGISSC